MNRQHRHSRSKTDFILEKTLWRWQNGWYNDSRVSYLLTQEIDNLSTRSAQFSGERECLRRFRLQELIRFDDILGEILRNVERVEFKKAVKKIREAEIIIKDLEMTLPMIKRYDAVQELIDELNELTGAPLFVDTTTQKVIADLQESSRGYLEKRQTHKAELNLFICRQEIEKLFHREMDTVKFEQLKKKVEKLANVLEQIHAVKFHAEERDKNTDFSMIDKLKSLIDSYYLTLAERLLEEFELQISDRNLFFFVSRETTQSSQNTKSRGKGHFPEIDKKYVNYWDHAAKQLLKIDLKVKLNHLKDIASQIKKIIEDIARKNKNKEK